MMSKMILQFTQYRNEFTNNTTLSTLCVGTEKICEVLEDFDRGLKQSMTEAETLKIKVPGKTAIGTGSYQIVITKSAKFGIHYPLLLGTVGFKGVRVHCGVNEHHTAGCPLVGMKRIKDGLQRSNEAFNIVFEKMLVHKTDLSTGRELMEIHKEFRRLRGAVNGDKVKMQKLADEFAAIYNPKYNANVIVWKVEHSIQNVIDYR